MIEVYNKQKIIDFLRKEDEIANLNMIGAIENIDQGIHNNPKDRLRMFVDDIDNPNGVIVNEHEYWYYLYAKNDEFIYKAKNKFFSQIESYGFDAVDQRVYDIMIKDNHMEWDEFCDLLYIDINEYQTYTNKIELTSGTIDDARIIDDLYTFKEDGSYDFIKDNLENRPSSVYRVNNEPVAWVLLHRDNSMGIMYTKKEYRGQNIAYELTMDITRKVIENHQIPFIHIGIENDPSFALAAKCGFKKYKRIVWFGINNEK